MADLLSVADLEAAKKHDTFHSEVITGKVGGLAGGANISTATNAVTGQVQRVLPEVLDSYGFNIAEFTFADGGVLDGKNILIPNSPANSSYYKYIGASAFPLTVAAGTNPVSNADWQSVLTTDARFLNNSKITVGSIKSLSVPTVTGQSLSVTGFYAGTTVGGGDFIYDASRDKADHNGGTVIAPEAIAAWDGSQVNLASLLNWTGAGVGCWVRSNLKIVGVTMFGAVADGVADDVLAMEAAHSTRKTVDYADGTYRISRPIVPPIDIDSTSRVLYINGSNLAMVTTNLRHIKCKILCDGDFIASGSEAQKIVINMKGVFLQANVPGVSAINGYNLEFSTIEWCCFEGFDYGLRGKLSNLSKVIHNHFIDCNVSAISNRHITGGDRSMTDCTISNNYLSGSVATPDASVGIGLDLLFCNLSSIENNFVDFWHTGINMDTGTSNVVSKNNIDYCFIGLLTKSLIASSVTLNNYTHIKKSLVGVFANPSAAMISDSWTAHKVRFGCQQMTISSNQCFDSDQPITLNEFSYTKLVTYGNTSSTFDEAVKVARSLDGSDPDDGVGLKVNELNMISYFSLPNVISGSFNGHTALYQNDIAINDGTQWLAGGQGANLTSDFNFKTGGWWEITASSWVQTTTGEGFATCVASDLIRTPATLSLAVGASYKVVVDIEATTVAAIKLFIGASGAEVSISPASTTRQIITVDAIAGSSFPRLYIRSDGFRGKIYSVTAKKII